MNSRKANARIDNSTRKLRLSFRPEQLHTGTYSTREWVIQFCRRLEHLKIATVLEEKIDGHHRDDKRHLSRDNACYTDFLVVSTLDYAESPPEQLAEAISHRESAGTLMWILKLDPDDFRESAFGQYDWWHALSGSEHEGRFKELGKDGWKDEQTQAAKLISNHPSCEHPSPACPNHRREPAASPSFSSRLGGWFKRHRVPMAPT